MAARSSPGAGVHVVRHQRARGRFFVRARRHVAVITGGDRRQPSGHHAVAWRHCGIGRCTYADRAELCRPHGRRSRRPRTSASCWKSVHTDGLPFIVGTDETVPDPSYGDGAARGNWRSVAPTGAVVGAAAASGCRRRGRYRARLWRHQSATLAFDRPGHPVCSLHARPQPAYHGVRGCGRRRRPI